MAHYYIGIDGGSQSTKITMFDERGNEILSCSQKISPTQSLHPGHVEHPNDDLWESLKHVCQKLMKQFQGNISDIRGLGLCSIRCCRAFLGKDGALVQPVMSWMDIRSYAPFEDRDEIAYTCAPSGYLTHRLTGNFIDTAPNTFQWQYPIDMETWQWSEDQTYFDSFGIPREKLFDLCMPGTILGHITAAAAQETGLPEGLPVVGTGNDKAVEALGAGLIEKGTGLVSLGTYITSMVCGFEHRSDADEYWTNLACVSGKYLYESQGIRLGMSHVTWYKNILGNAYAHDAEARGMSVEETLEAEAKDLPAGSEGLMVIPDWLAPADQLYRKGVMLGFDTRHTRAHLYKAVLEGIAMTQMEHYFAMTQKLGEHPERIILSGGGSNSNLFMQIFADMYGVKTLRNVTNGAAGTGAAICAAVAVGEYDSFESAVEGMVKERDVFLPNAQNHKKYQQIYECYKELPSQLEPILKHIHENIESV